MVRKRNPAVFSAREIEFIRSAVVVVVPVAVVVVVGSSITSGLKEWRGSMKKKGRVEKAKEFKQNDIRFHDEKRLERTMTIPLSLFTPPHPPGDIS